MRRAVSCYNVHTVRWKDSVWEELLWAATGMALVATIVSVLYWAFSGLSPWPFVVGAEVVGAVLGVIILMITRPSRS
ncbi:MAG: hypothetical protein HYX97_02465 [Chloroflexi bacterium]|nr:hypothetical protein [Chloroflexota bacterium]